MYKILIAEDDNNLSEELKVLFARYNFEIKFAGIEKDIYNNIEQWNPKVILINSFFAKHQGTEIFKKLKSAEKINNIPVMLYSSDHTHIALAKKDSAMHFDILDLYKLNVAYSKSSPASMN